MLLTRHFRDREGVGFGVIPLTRAEAERHVLVLVEMHNDVPFQHWTPQEFLAGGDMARTYHGKWELSALAVAMDGSPIGFCIAFELEPDHRYYHDPGIYMHRMSLARPYRRRQIGALLHAETLWRAFSRGLRTVAGKSRAVVIYGQTNEGEQNASILSFHRDAGFRAVGRKEYPNRIDVIMRMTLDDFLCARHTSLWLSRAVEREGLPDQASRDCGSTPADVSH